jgi:crotonobetainyl-CoA:carnitine CoA-transferase CaiB-like acyl-CoA transferase
MSQIPLATPLAGIKVLEFSHTVMGDGQAVIHRLIPTADLVLENFGRGT